VKVKCRSFGPGTPVELELVRWRAPLKKITGFIKLQLPAGKANPSPPVGPLWASMASTSWPSARTSTPERRAGGHDHPRGHHGDSDRSFTFVMKTPPAAVLLKKAAPPRRRSRQRRERAETRTRGEDHSSQLRELRHAQAPDIDATSVECGHEEHAGTARSMGIDIVD